MNGPPQRYEAAADIDTLIEHPANPRRGDEAAIDDSMAAHGFFGAVLVQESTNWIIAGNHRTRVARRRGHTTIPVFYLDVDDDQARKILLQDNRTSDDARYDARELADLLEQILADEGDLDGSGYDAGDLAELLGRWDQAGDPDAPPPVPKIPISTRGDLYALGRHRILCGSCTDEADVARLLEGRPRPKLMVTDPPYLVGYTGANHPQNTENAAVHDPTWDEAMTAGDAAAFYARFLRIALEHLTDGAAVYQWHASRRQDLVEAAWRQHGLLWHQTVYWMKNRPVLTRSDFMWSIEPAAYGWVQPTGPEPADEPDEATAAAVAELLERIDSPAFGQRLETSAYGWRIGSRPETGRRPPANASNVWELPNASANVDHPTIKPLQLYADPFNWHLRTGEHAYEPFSGSGTAICAGQVTDRNVDALELAPEYVDVSIARWQTLTGDTPTLISRQPDGPGTDIIEVGEPADIAAQLDGAAT